MRLSTPSSNSTNAPYGTRFVILPLTCCPAGNRSSIWSHGFFWVCFRPNETRSFSLLISSTTTSSGWPTLSSSLGCPRRSEEHTSELQSQSNLVCRLLLEKKKNTNTQYDLP